MSTLKVNNLQDLGADAVVTNGVVNASALPAGSVLQVVSTTKTDTFTSASTTFTDVTGLSATITPRSISSKIAVIVSFTGNGGAGVSGLFARLVRDSTPIAVADAAGSRQQTSNMIYYNDSSVIAVGSVNTLDSPATTSAVTYKLQIRVSSGTGYINRSETDTDASTFGRSASSITLMEVAG